MKDIRQGICPLCSHNEIIQASPVEWVPYGVGPVVLAATHEKDRTVGVDPAKPLGIMNIWICRRCGLVQWFAFESEKIPIDEKYLTRLVRGSEPEGPYR